MGLVSILEDIEKRKAGLEAALAGPDIDSDRLHAQLVASGLVDHCERLLKAARDAHDPGLDLAIELQSARSEIRRLEKTQTQLALGREASARRMTPRQEEANTRLREANVALRDEVRRLREQNKLLHQRVKAESQRALNARLWAGIPPRQPKRSPR